MENEILISETEQTKAALPLVEVKDVSMRFRMPTEKIDNVKEFFIKLVQGKLKYDDFWVLKNISFEIHRGESVGILGRNGAGKSTLLKLISGIVEPTSGSIRVRGSIVPLLRLGAGFDPNATGKENVFLNGAMMGFSKKEMQARYDSIVEFSELGRFMNMPLKNFSSGMLTRLGFSIAVDVNPDLLIIDEILAVGDTNFQAKCFSKLQEIKAKGTTIVIVSHSLEQIEAFCDRTVWINDGKIVADGLPRDIHPEYLDYMGQLRNDQLKKEKAREEGSVEEESGEEETEEKEEDKKRFGNGDAKITNVKILDKDGEEKTVFHVGSKITIRVTFKVKKKIEDAVFGVGIFRNDGVYCYGTNTRIDRLPKFDIEKDGVLEIEMPVVDLLPGKYLVDLAIQSGNWVPVDYYKEACSFETYSKREDCGIVRINQTWHLPEDIRKE